LFALIIYTGICVVYLLVFAIAGILKTSSVIQLNNNSFHKIAVLIPAYKEDAVIIEVAKQALLQSYPQALYDVVIIADSLKPSTLQQLKALPIQLFSVAFEHSTKAKALNLALQQLQSSYDIAVVLDADNIMHTDFLEKVNASFAAGWKAIQCHRIAKNTNTSVAILDAISEEINNHIFRKGHRKLGLSSALIGSGMAFDYTIFKNTMAEINSVSGFDKELELSLLTNRYTIEFLPDAFIYDEKVQTTKDFRNQRTRWIAAQLKYLHKYFLKSVYHLIFNGNVDLFDKVVQFLLLPRILLLGLLHLILLLSLLIQEDILRNAAFLELVLLIGTLFLSTPKHLLKKISWKELVDIPKLFIQFIASLANIRQAQKKFIHTPHGEI
jgi:cellulose synthase/poly-beta-1,6-N-acetylglucosamine synthase-like glycosyltransferase